MAKVYKLSKGKKVYKLTFSTEVVTLTEGEELIAAAEAAKLLGKDVSQINRMMNAGILDAYFLQPMVFDREFRQRVTRYTTRSEIMRYLSEQEEDKGDSKEVSIDDRIG
jgi:hypothetical protein